MRPELEQKLMNEFPFMECRHWKTGKLLGLPVECACDDGWYDIIYRLCQKIKGDLALYPNPDFHVQQAKEKMSGLYFFTSSIPKDSKIFNYIAEAEHEANDTCEFCGSKVDVRVCGRRWYKTLCHMCSRDYNG